MGEGEGGASKEALDRITQKLALGYAIEDGVERYRGWAPCHHGNDEKGKAASEKMYEDCYAALEAKGYVDLRTHPDRDLLDAIVQSLNWDYDAMIVGIPTDQWSAVRTERHRWVELPDDAPDDADEWPLVFRTWVECDQILDGIVATYLVYYEHFGDPHKEERNS